MLILKTLIIFFFNILLYLSDVMSSNQKKNLGIYEFLGVYVICIHIINIKGLLRYIQA